MDVIKRRGRNSTNFSHRQVDENEVAGADGHSAECSHIGRINLPREIFVVVAGQSSPALTTAHSTAHSTAQQFSFPIIQQNHPSKMSSHEEIAKLHEELFKKGLSNRRQVVGDAYVDAALRNGSSEFAYPGQQLVTE